MAQKIDLELKSYADYVNEEAMPPFAITIAGDPGVGKSTLALSMSSEMPVYFLETEKRFKRLAKKLHKEVINPENIFAIEVSNWGDILIALGTIKKAIKDNDPTNKGVVIIDSATDFKNFADHEWRETNKTFPPVNWSKLYKMMNDVVNGIKSLGLSIVFTNRVKPDYDSDGNQTGSVKIDQYKNQKDLSEVALLMLPTGDIEVHKNSWHDMLVYHTDSEGLNRNMTLPQIIEKLQS
tara:strand:- start:1666 stop:2376 length:711 start_codon:yes stop_codon:yes gene_type:complete